MFPLPRTTLVMEEALGGRTTPSSCPGISHRTLTGPAKTGAEGTSLLHLLMSWLRALPLKGFQKLS